MLEHLICIVTSFFIHHDFVEAFKAAPHGIWDYFHKAAHPNHPRLTATSNKTKGYCQELFERELEVVQEAIRIGTDKLQTCSVDFSVPYHLADNLFYRINHSILEAKLDFLTGLVLSAQAVTESSQDDLADYVHEQHSKVNNESFVF